LGSRVERIAALSEELGVFGGLADELMLLGERRRGGGLKACERLREQLLGQDSNGLV
jgi:hypothetical protein